MVKYNWACHEHTSNSRNWFLEILCLECTHTKTVCGLFIHSLPELRMQIPLNQAGNNKMLMHQHNHSFYTTNILHNYLSLYNFWNFLFCGFKLTFSYICIGNIRPYRVLSADCLNELQISKFTLHIFSLILSWCSQRMQYYVSTINKKKLIYVLHLLFKASFYLGEFFSNHYIHMPTPLGQNAQKLTLLSRVKRRCMKLVLGKYRVI